MGVGETDVGVGVVGTDVGVGVVGTDVSVGVGETAGPVAVGVAVGSGLQAAARAMTATKPKVGVLIRSAAGMMTQRQKWTTSGWSRQHGRSSSVFSQTVPM